MNGDQRLLMVELGESGPVAVAMVRAHCLFSRAAKVRRRQFRAASAMLRTALSHDDRRVTVRPSHTIGAPAFTKWLLFAALLAVIALEYRDYTLPVLQEWIRAVAQRCGF